MVLKSGLVNEAIKYKIGNSKGGIEKILRKSEEELYLRNKEISLSALKNDFVAFQIFLKSNEDFILSTSGSTVFSEYGKINIIRLEVKLNLNDIDAEVFPVGLIEDDDRCLKADILLNNETIYVKKGICQPIWIEFKVPENFEGDKIYGTVELYSHILFNDEIKVRNLNFKVNVADLVLPDPKNFKFYFGLGFHPSNIARQYEVKLWSNSHFNIIEKYIESLSNLGLKVIQIVLSEIPWSGQGCYMVKSHLSNLFEYNIVKVTKDINGELRLDISKLDKLIDLCLRYHIKEFHLIGLLGVWNFPNEGFGSVLKDYSDAIRIRYYDEKDNLFKYLTSRDEIEKYITELKIYLISKKIIDKITIGSDEPSNNPSNLKIIKDWVGFLRNIYKKFNINVADNIDFILNCDSNLYNELMIYVESLFNNWEKIPALRKRLSKLYWYTCCGQFPDSCIRANLLESRFIGWLSAFMDLDGFFRWAYTAWPENPREKIYWNAPLFPAGENNFVYPAKDGTPLLSLRYKNLLRGIQDYELINMVREKYIEDDSNVLLENAFKKIIRADNIFNGQIFTEEKRSKIISLDYEDYKRARDYLVNKIIEKREAN